jgi:hypothetical protein
VWVFEATFVVLRAALLALLAVLVFRADLAWPVLFHEFRGSSSWVVLHLTALAAFALIAAGRLPNATYNLAFAVITASMYAGASVVPLGNLEGVLAEMTSREIAVTHPLSEWIFRIADEVMNLDYVPVAIGTVTAMVYLHTCDRIFLTADRAASSVKRLFSLLFLASPFHLLFLPTHLEKTAASVPFLLLSIGAGVTYLRSNSPSFDRSILWVSMAYALAVMAHASAVFLAPAFPAMIGLRRYFDGQYALLLVDVGILLGALVAVTTVVLGGSSLAGYELVPGTLGGGGDQSRFVPMTVTASHFIYFTMFSLDHAVQIANITALAFPTAAIASALVPVRLLARDRPARISERAFLVILSLGYLAFISLWGFDLGFPSDLYLMLGISAPLQLLGALLLLELPRKVAWPLAGSNLAYAWSVTFLCIR